MMKPRRMRWAGHVAHMGTMINAYNILVRKPVGKRRDDNMGIDLRVTGCEDVVKRWK
jgi:hypothetical protein